MPSRHRSEPLVQAPAPDAIDYICEFGCQGHEARKRRWKRVRRESWQSRFCRQQPLRLQPVCTPPPFPSPFLPDSWSIATERPSSRSLKDRQHIVLINNMPVYNGIPAYSLPQSPLQSQHIQHIMLYKLLTTPGSALRVITT